MAIADPDEPKKDGEETPPTGVTEGSIASASTDTAYKKSRNTLRSNTPMRLYSKIKDFSFSIPEGWPDNAVVTFLNCCKDNIEDLKNYSDDQQKWCNIATSGAEITKRFDCFTVNNCIELGQSLKHFVTKYKDRIDSDEDFKLLFDDLVDLLPYFPPIETEAKKVFIRSRSKSSETKIEPAVVPTIDPREQEIALENQIISLGKQYAGLFGAKGSTPAYIWREMSRKIGEKLGIKVNVREHLEIKKRQIASEVQEETDPVARERKFLQLTKDYISYFDYIPPRKIKISDFCLSHRGQHNQLEDDTDIATDATVELTEEEGESDHRINDFEIIDKMEEDLLDAIKKENTEEPIVANEETESTEPMVKKKARSARRRYWEFLVSENESEVSELTTEGKLNPALLEKTRKETLRTSRKPVLNPSVGESKVTLAENGDGVNDDNLSKKRRMPRRKVEAGNFTDLPKRKGLRDKTGKESESVSDDQSESAKTTETKPSRTWARGRKRKIIPEVTENKDLSADEPIEEAAVPEITSPRQNRYSSRSKSKITESAKSKKPFRKESTNSETDDNNESPSRNRLKNKISSETSQKTHNSILNSMANSFFLDSDKIRKNPFVRLSPVPDSLSQLIANPVTIRIPEQQMASAKTNQESKKILTKAQPRAKAKLMEERVAVPKDVVQTVYNPSSDSAKTKVVRNLSSPRNSGRTNKIHAKDEKTSSKSSNSKILTRDDKMLSIEPSVSSFPSKDGKLPTKPIHQLDINRFNRNEPSSSPMTSDSSNSFSDYLEKEAALMQLLPAKAIPQPHPSSYPSHSNYLSNGSDSLPPKWFEGFTLNHKKHEAWKIGQLMKIQTELISMEKKKLAVLQNILCTLNNRR